MSRTRAATPAGRTRTTRTRRAPARSPAKRAPAKRPAAKRAPAKRKPARRAAPKRKRAAPKRSRTVRAKTSWRFRLVALAAAILAAGGGYVFWLRDSSLVAVTDVEVVGVTTSDRGEIVAALTSVAEGMTTLHYDADRIESVAARFPTVAAIDIDPNFPHGMRLEIQQRPPRLFAESGGQQVPVAADGTVLAGVTVPEEQPLPVLELSELPTGERLSGEPLEQAMIIGAAPDPLLGLVESSDYGEEFGTVITLRGGLEVRFGSGDRAADKWAAAAAVLADPKLDVATYIDVRVPERPAVGGAA